MENVFPFIAIGAFVAIFIVFVLLGVRQSRRARENLAALALRLGLPPPEEPAGFWGRLRAPSFRGSVRGRQLRVYTYSTGSGKNRTQWCALALSINNPGGLKLGIARENLLTRAGRAFGLNDVATGDEAFDRAFYVKSNDATYVRAALLPEVRARIAETWRQGARGAIKVEGGEISYAEAGTFASRRICERWPVMVDLAFLLADVVEARDA